MIRGGKLHCRKEFNLDAFAQQAKIRDGMLQFLSASFRTLFVAQTALPARPD